MLEVMPVSCRDGPSLSTMTLESMMNPLSTACVWPKRVSACQEFPGGYVAAESSARMSSLSRTSRSCDTSSGVVQVRAKGEEPMPPAPKTISTGMMKDCSHFSGFLRYFRRVCLMPCGFAQERGHKYVVPKLGYWRRLSVCLRIGK